MTDLTTEALAGYATDDLDPETCPYIETSPAADAWYVGRHLRRNGAPRPTKATSSRGHSIRINGTHLFRLNYGPRGTAVEAI